MENNLKLNESYSKKYEEVLKSLFKSYFELDKLCRELENEPLNIFDLPKNLSIFNLEKQLTNIKEETQILKSIRSNIYTNILKLKTNVDMKINKQNIFFKKLPIVDEKSLFLFYNDNIIGIPELQDRFVVVQFSNWLSCDYTQDLCNKLLKMEYEIPLKQVTIDGLHYIVSCTVTTTEIK